MFPEQEVEFSTYSMCEIEFIKLSTKNCLHVFWMAGDNNDVTKDIKFEGIPICHVSPVAHLAEAHVLEIMHAFSEGIYPQRPAGDENWWKTSSRASEFPELVLIDEFCDEEGEEDASNSE